jgi:hypothetical protein
MTEEQIESRVCAMFDALDARFLAPSAPMMTQEEYDRESSRINDWAEAQYRARYPQWDRQ